MEFCEGIQGAQTLALHLANEKANSPIQQVSQRCRRTWERQGIYGVKHDVGFLTFSIVVHLVRGEKWRKSTSEPPSPDIAGGEILASFPKLDHSTCTKESW